MSPAIPDAARFLSTLENLVVVSRCDCGCDTVDFRSSDPEGTPGVVADGVGETRDGATVNVIVFAADQELVSLEVCGVAAETARLPARARSTAILARIGYLHEEAGRPNPMPVENSPLLDVLAAKIAAATDLSSRAGWWMAAAVTLWMLGFHPPKG